MALYTEDRRLKFDDSQAVNAEIFDDNTTHKAPAWKKVDFIVEWENEFWLVEVKDPTDEYTIRRNSSDKIIIEPYICEYLFYNNIGPKGRDSFLYLHLFGQLPETKKIRYLVLIANDFNKPASLSNRNSVLRHIMAINNDWSFFESVAVLNLETWNEYYHDMFPVERLS